MTAGFGRSPNLLGYDRKALTGWLAGLAQPEFRARQLLKWIHGRGETDFANMTDLSVALRKQLADLSICVAPKLRGQSEAKDGTRKFLFDAGGPAIEAVWIPEVKRRTLCVSSQAGCALGCTFCLTGKQGFERNLDSWQIIGQLAAVNNLLGDTGRVTNVVFMGMGEPLLNLENVEPALRVMIDPLGYGISRRKVTVSTAGVVPGIDRLRDSAPVALAISLHAADDELRSELVPLNRRYPLSDLLGACRRYLEAAPRDFITFEYIMLDHVNDAPSQARDLVRLLSRIPAKINLIPFNAFPGSSYQASSSNRLYKFRDTLNTGGLIATIRRQRGNDILAACGQLAGEVSGRVPASGRVAMQLVQLSN